MAQCSAGETELFTALRSRRSPFGYNPCMHSCAFNRPLLRAVQLWSVVARPCGLHIASSHIRLISMQPLQAQDQNRVAGEAPQKKLRMEPLRVQTISPTATLPKRGSAQAAGYDLASSEDTVVPARDRACVSTGLVIAVPPGTYGRVAPRSGLAVKHFIDTGAGVIDEDYRGEVKVVLFNHSDKDFPIKVGDRIAQLVLECIVSPEVQQVDELSATERGAGGFGSTGVAAQ